MVEEIERNGGHNREKTTPDRVERVKAQIWTCNEDGILKQLEERKKEIDSVLANRKRMLRNLVGSPIDYKHVDKIDEMSVKSSELRRMIKEGDKLEIQIREIESFREEFGDYKCSLDMYSGNVSQMVKKLSAHVKRLPLPISLDDSYLKNVQEEIDSAGTFYSLEKFFSGVERGVLASATSGLESRFPSYTNPMHMSRENIETLINRIKKGWTIPGVSGEKIAKNIEYTEEVLKKYSEEIKGQKDIAEDPFTKEYLSAKESLKSLRVDTFRCLLDYSGRLNRDVVELDDKTNSFCLWSSMDRLDISYGTSPVFGKIKEALEMHKNLSKSYLE